MPATSSPRSHRTRSRSRSRWPDARLRQHREAHPVLGPSLILSDPTPRGIHMPDGAADVMLTPAGFVGKSARRTHSKRLPLDDPGALLDQSRVRSPMKRLMVVMAVVGVCVALFLAFGLSRTRVTVQEPRANRDGLPDNSAPPSTIHTETVPRIPQHNTPPSLSADGATTTVALRSDSGRNTTTLPATIEEAIATNSALAKDLACRDSQAKYSMDYKLRMIAGVRDCLAERTQSTGRISFMLHFDNDPATRRSVGTHLEPLTSELTAEDDLIVLECVKAFHAGSVLMNSEKYGGGSARYVSTNLNLPLEDSYIFKMVREGSYTAGTTFGCEVP